MHSCAEQENLLDNVSDEQKSQNWDDFKHFPTKKKLKQCENEIEGFSQGKAREINNPNWVLKKRLALSFSDSDLLEIKDSISMNWVTTPDYIRISLRYNNVNCGGTISQHGKLFPIPAHVSTIDGNYCITTRRNTKSSILTCSGLGALSFHRFSPSSQGGNRGIRGNDWLPSSISMVDRLFPRWADILHGNTTLLSIDSVDTQSDSKLKKRGYRMVSLDISIKYLLLPLNFGEFFCQHWRQREISRTGWGT